MRFRGKLFFLGPFANVLAILVLAAEPAAWADSCVELQGAPKLGSLDAVVSYLAKNAGPAFVKSCQEPGAASVENCLVEINSGLAKRYGDVSSRIEGSMKGLDAITLPKNAAGNLKCGSGKATTEKTVTSEPVRLPYHIAPSSADAQKADLQKMIHALKLDSVPDPQLASASVRLSLGRGSAADYQRAVERLACVSGAEFNTASGARAALAKASIGIDCAGATQILLRDATGKAGNAELGLLNPAAEGFSKTLMAERKKFFVHSADPLSIRPGDVIPLDPPGAGKVGHVVIAQDVRFEITKKAAATTAAGLSFEAQQGDQLMKVKVASSWGGGGPSIETWVYNMRTRKWASQKDDGTYSFGVSGPYNHPYDGQYRSKELPQ